MSDVLVFERASATFAAGLAKRGHHIVYRANSANHCPGCGRSQWYIGRVSAECGFCGTAVPLAETGHRKEPRPAPRKSNASATADQRRFPRMSGKGRKLKLLIDGSPHSFALHNISEGGVMGGRRSGPRARAPRSMSASKAESSSLPSSAGPKTGSSASPSSTRSSSTGRTRQAN